eukprot:gnl/MRDRNA2_/MRDRNA2_44400_c0_seq1.p1 gnl/MRDRNA2_/MRDRNA2_44400_c0~~gnl/MRDRNA2_/MRDRNA2_44400_c0_seq1.p1  ORF type:complete len:446 (+),score=97.15 gnl/MRDRNA2_/MRDRNA2_44400_c0_seq1:56-1393(+)
MATEQHSEGVEDVASNEQVERGVKRQCEDDRLLQSSSKRTTELMHGQFTSIPCEPSASASGNGTVFTYKKQKSVDGASQKHLQEMQELERECQNDMNKLKKRQEEQMKLKVDEAKAKMEKEIKSYETHQSCELIMLFNKHSDRQRTLRGTQLKEVFAPVLRITGAKPSFLYGCYELELDASTFTEPVYKMCKKFRDVDLWLYLDKSKERWVISKTASNDDAHNTCGFARSDPVKPGTNPTHAMRWKHVKDHKWVAWDVTVEELPATGIEVIIRSLAGDVILQKSYPASTRIHVLKSELVKFKTKQTVDICFRNRKLTGPTLLGSIGFKQGDGLSAFFQKAKRICSGCEEACGPNMCMMKCDSCKKRYCGACGEDEISPCDDCFGQYCDDCFGDHSCEGEEYEEEDDEDEEEESEDLKDTQDDEDLAWKLQAEEGWGKKKRRPGKS